MRRPRPRRMSLRPHAMRAARPELGWWLRPAFLLLGMLLGAVITDAYQQASPSAGAIDGAVAALPAVE